MVVPVTRMIIRHNTLITNLLSVYSTGYGIGTVFPFGLIYRVIIIIIRIILMFMTAFA